MSDMSDLIEHHAKLLKKPIEGGLLYKIIPSKHFFDMIDKKYLYFNRVDQYKDDIRDSDQPDEDRLITTQIKFQNDPKFTLAQYYYNTRRRSYACCFTTEISDYVWDQYSEDDPNALCLVVDCHKMIKYLNNTYRQWSIPYRGKRLAPFFCLNYGLVRYGSLASEGLVNDSSTLPNPIQYLYLKDNQYANDEEFRITLLVPGIGEFQLSDRSGFEFPPYLHLDFDYKKALSLGVITQLQVSPRYEKEFISTLKERLQRVGDVRICYQ